MTRSSSPYCSHADNDNFIGNGMSSKYLYTKVHSFHNAHDGQYAKSASEYLQLRFEGKQMSVRTFKVIALHWEGQTSQ